MAVSAIWQPRGWSFRTRLAVTIGAVFVAAAAALLVVEYLAVDKLFDAAITSSSVGIAGGTPGTVIMGRADAAPVVPAGMLGTISGPAEAAPGPDVLGPMVTITSIEGENVRQWFVGQSGSLAGEVRTGLLVWSGVVLAVFAALAALISWWLARRAVRRIGEVTAMAKDLSRHDLGRRLELQGPPDEIKELADTVDAMLDRLEAAFTAQDRFVANASHELRTPLTTARTALEIPLAQGRVPDDLAPAFRTALRAGRHSEDLITGLLTLARSGRIPSVEPVDLADVVPGVLAESRDLLLDNDIEVHLTTSSVLVTADPTMVTQAVRNLVENAIVHNDPGGQVWIDIGTDGLVVENTGPEVDPELVELLAEPFYRIEARTSRAEASRSTGAGLGLSIVRSIAHAHEGRLDLTTRAGGGLRAALTLPVPGPSDGADRGRVTVGEPQSSPAARPG